MQAALVLYQQNAASRKWRCSQFTGRYPKARERQQPLGQWGNQQPVIVLCLCAQESCQTLVTGFLGKALVQQSRQQARMPLKELAVVAVHRQCSQWLALRAAWLQLQCQSCSRNNVIHCDVLPLNKATYQQALKFGVFNCGDDGAESVVVRLDLHMACGLELQDGSQPFRRARQLPVGGNGDRIIAAAVAALLPLHSAQPLLLYAAPQLQMAAQLGGIVHKDLCAGLANG